MSVRTQVFFVAKDADLDATIARLGELFQVQFVRFDDDGLIRYEYSSVGFVLVAYGDHGFEGEVDGQYFSDYDVVISCIASDPSLDYEAAESIRMGIGMYVFRKLVAKGVRAMFVYDLQRLIEVSETSA